MSNKAGLWRRKGKKQTAWQKNRSQFATSKSIIMGARKLPYAFTENGVAMLSSVLCSQTAIEANIRIMRVFVSMHRFITTNAQYPFIEIKRFNKAHDRFWLIDDEVFHIGALVKDLGKKWFGFTLMRDITELNSSIKSKTDKVV